LIVYVIVTGGILWSDLRRSLPTTMVSRDPGSKFTKFGE